MAEVVEPKADHKLGPYPAIFKFYEDGKARRYTILFTVNTAVFGILKIVPDAKLGAMSGLDIALFARGMAMFTVVMGFDLWMFGTKMRKAGDDNAPLQDGIFAIPGRLVLLILCGLMAGAWLAVANGAAATPAEVTKPGAAAAPVQQFGLFNLVTKG